MFFARLHRPGEDGGIVVIAAREPRCRRAFDDVLGTVILQWHGARYVAADGEREPIPRRRRRDDLDAGFTRQTGSEQGMLRTDPLR
jgi:hypothetical protein